MGQVRARLAAATADIHEALHGAEPFARIAQGGITRAEYGGLLQMLYRYHSAMAPACIAGAAALGLPALAAAHQLRLRVLCADMEYLGVPSAARAGEAIADPAMAIGCLYTVQGSTLGGKVIFRQLDGFLPDGRGRAFFQGTQEDGAHWKQLCDGLESQAARLDGMIAGARHAFARFAALLPQASAVA